MNKKIVTIIGALALGIALFALALTGSISKAQDANSPSEWTGSWQMGPDLDTSVLGCNSGDGLARFTGIYYPEQDRVYFLGGRCETDTITVGSVFYFDPVTETYVATGTTMPTPVSNYQVVRVDDDGRGHGPGLYIVGGRKGDGTLTSDVQVYYPDDNTAEAIASDPFPPVPVYFPGGVAAHDNIIYAFGGFDATNMYDNTYIYDSSAPEGERWTLSDCHLPSGRAYIAAITVGTKIYAIGGDEVPVLTPIVDTEVYDTADPGACWQDDLMADLPDANGDAPAVFVDENYIGGTGGGIFVVGGYWPSPGPNRWVFRYDLPTDTWETFPDLAIPAPATGRRNQPAVYIPSTSGGTGAGVPGMWTFGGYDGSATNAMTQSSEFFANPASSILLNPDFFEVSGLPGTTVSDNFTLVNQSGITDTYVISYTSDVTWTVTLPGSIGPIPDGSQDTFEMTIEIPADADCSDTGSFTVTTTSLTDPGINASATITARAICGVYGIIADADSGFPLQNAYVWIQNTVDGLDVYYDGYTDATGFFLMQDVAPDTYYFGADALQHQPSFYPEGWPDGAITLTLGTKSVNLGTISLVASKVDWDPAEMTVNVVAGGSTNQTLTINNTGSGPYNYNISVLDGSQAQPPEVGGLAIPNLPRVDDQIFTDISASPSGTADFVAVLDTQADLSAAYGIKDWTERGRAVYDMLTKHADSSQAGLRAYLNSQGINYTPLYIINAVIVHSGDANLVNNLSARLDVSQLVGNHRIAVEKPISSYWDQLLQPVIVPTAIEWNISKIKADQVWSGYGVTGEGEVVAEIDTGTQWDHPALINHYRGWNGANADHNYNWYDPYNQCAGGEPCDPGGHGTHVMGTMVGDDGAGNQIGVAPGAKWISCKGGDAVSGFLLTNELLTCAQWILAPWDLNGQNPNPDMRPNAVNNSWGGGPEDYWYTGAISAWRAAGIFPSFANGNAGPGCSTAHSPGDNWLSFASGASDVNNNIAGFSSRGPSEFWGFLKPQITAPGVSVRSSYPTNSYAYLSGTSMATPHSTAAVALLWSAVPELTGQIELTSWVLEESATPLYTTDGCGGDLPDSHPNNTFGYGLLDIYNAVTIAKGETFTPDWVSVDPQYGTVEASGSAAVNVTFNAPDATGTYTATLWLVGDDPYNPDVRIPLTLNVIAPTYSVDLSPEAAALTMMPGDTAIYNLTLTNTGDVQDTFDLSVAGNLWVTTLSDAQVTLDPGASTEITVSVVIPGDAQDGESDTAVITATSQGDPTVSKSSTLTTTAVWRKVYLPIIFLR